MTITKKKTYKALVIIMALSFAAGLTSDCFNKTGLFRGEMHVTLLLAFALSMFDFAAILIFDKIRKFIGLEKKSVKPFIVCAAVFFIATLIFYGFLAADDIQKFGFISFLAELTIFFYVLPFSCLYLMLFLIDVDESEHIVSVSFEDYVLTRRESEKENKDNTPVTIKNLRAPEQYFKDEEYKSLFEENFDSIMEQALMAAKPLIFENNLQYDTCGEYFLSRIDFLDDLDSDAPLRIDLTFISKKTTVYTLYGLVDLNSRTTEKDYCRVLCEFSYDTSNEQPFILEEAAVEII